MCKTEHAENWVPTVMDRFLWPAGMQVVHAGPEIWIGEDAYVERMIQRGPDPDAIIALRSADTDGSWEDDRLTLSGGDAVHIVDWPGTGTPI